MEKVVDTTSSVQTNRQQVGSFVLIYGLNFLHSLIYCVQVEVAAHAHIHMCLCVTLHAEIRGQLGRTGSLLSQCGA